MRKREKIKEVNDAVNVYFKAHGLSHRDVAERLGYKNTSIVNNQLSYGRFGARMAHRWAVAFGFNEDFLITGKGKLIARQGSYQKLVSENESLNAIIRSLKAANSRLQEENRELKALLGR